MYDMCIYLRTTPRRTIQYGLRTTETRPTQTQQFAALELCMIRTARILKKCAPSFLRRPPCCPASSCDTPPSSCKTQHLKKTDKRQNTTLKKKQTRDQRQGTRGDDRPRLSRRKHSVPCGLSCMRSQMSDVARRVRLK